MIRILAAVSFSLVVSGCQLEEENSDLDLVENSRWNHLDKYSGFSGLVLGGGLAKDSVFLFGATEVSKIDNENVSTHFLKYRPRDINEFASSVGPSYFASTYGEGEGFFFRSSVDPIRSTQYSYTAQLSLSEEQWLNEVPYPGRVSRPMITGGAEAFGIFNNNDLFLTLVSAGTEHCYITLVELEYTENVDSYYPVIKATIPIGSPCYSGGDSVSYSTDGENFYVATLSSVGSYKVSPTGEVTKIWDGRASNIYYHSDKYLFLQDDANLYLSRDGGENWELIWQRAFSFNLKFFSVKDNLYFYYNRQIFKIDINDEKMPITEIDNAGLDENESYISSAIEFNDKVYVSTFGEGVFYKSISEFDPNIEK